MKRIDLERHLRKQGCSLYREGGGHSVWLNPLLRKVASIPRHREIKEGTVAPFVSSLKSPALTLQILNLAPRSPLVYAVRDW